METTLARVAEQYLQEMHQRVGIEPVSVRTTTSQRVTAIGQRIEKISVGCDCKDKHSCKGTDADKRRAVALFLQKIYRSYRTRADAKSAVRQRFCASYGENGERASINDLFAVSSEYLTLLLFILRSDEGKIWRSDDLRFYGSESDFQRLFIACELFLTSVKERSIEWQLVFKSSPNPDSACKIVQSRLKRFIILCSRVLPEVWMHRRSSENERAHLLRTISALTEPLVFGKSVQTFVVTNGILPSFRRLVLGIGDSVGDDERALLEKLLFRLGICSMRLVSASALKNDGTRCFVTQILTVPSLWKRFPHLTQKVLLHECFFECFANNQASFVDELEAFMPRKEYEMPSLGCFLGNALVVACNVLKDMSICKPSLVDKVIRLPFNMKFLAVLKGLDEKGLAKIENRKNADAEKELVKEFKEQTLKFSFLYVSQRLDSYCRDYPKSSVSGVFDAVFYVMRKTCLQTPCPGAEKEMERAIISFWSFIKLCEANKIWPDTGISEVSANWIMPVIIFTIIYAKFLMNSDYHRFYKEQDVISLQDVKLLISILKQKLWSCLKLYSSSGEGSMEGVVLLKIVLVMRLLIGWNCKSRYIPTEDFVNPSCLEKEPDTVMRLAPFLIPYQIRVIFFKQMMAKEQGKRNAGEGSVTVMVKRKNLVEDAMDAINRLSVKQLQRNIQVIFVNESGEKEGCFTDRGRSFKELVEVVIKEAFKPKYGLFKESRDYSLYPDPDSAKNHPQHLKCFEFLGKLLGKAMCEGILVHLHFNKFFLKKLQDEDNDVNDLLYFDADLYNNLFSLEHQGGFPECGLHFVVKSSSGEEVELAGGGKNKQVNSQNVREYIHLMADYLLNTQIADQCKAFIHGMSQVFNNNAFLLFNEAELQTILCA